MTDSGKILRPGAWVMIGVGTVLLWLQVFSGLQGLYNEPAMNGFGILALGLVVLHITSEGHTRQALEQEVSRAD